MALALVAVAVIVHRVWGDHLRRWSGGSAAIPTRAAGDLRVATWNVHNLPAPEQDLDRLRTHLMELDADVAVLQEVVDASALSRILEGWEVHTSRFGGRGDQHVAIAFDPDRVEKLSGPLEHDEVSLDGRVRPALSVHLRHRGGGPDFWVVGVHLKAFPEGIDLRRTQWGALAGIVSELRRSDADVLVLGDFNVTGATGGRPAEERAELDAALAGPGLRRVRNSVGCTAYWDGSRRDGWKEASLLDLIYAAGFDESLSAGVRAYAAGLCARHDCAPFRSTRAYPEPDFARVSDHCPVVIDLAPGDDD